MYLTTEDKKYLIFVTSGNEEVKLAMLYINDNFELKFVSKLEETSIIYIITINIININ